MVDKKKKPGEFVLYKAKTAVCCGWCDRVIENDGCDECGADFYEDDDVYCSGADSHGIREHLCAECAGKKKVKVRDER